MKFTSLNSVRVILVVACVNLVSCDGDDDEPIDDTTAPSAEVAEVIGAAGCPLLTGTGDFTEVAGLYDISDDDADEEQDIGYMEISAEGDITLYDYQQDRANVGANCYLITTGRIVLDGGDATPPVWVSYVDEDVNCETQFLDTSISGDESGLSLSFRDQSVADFVDTVYYPRAIGISAVDFNQCE